MVPGFEAFSEFKLGSDFYVNGSNKAFNIEKDYSKSEKSSLGLKLIMDRLQLMSQENDLKWNLSLKNQINKSGKISGVEVIALLPILIDNTDNTEIDTVEVLNETV
jgi:hypothetical protein